MKQTKEITIPAQPERITTKNIYMCDICGKERITTKCVICGRDVCISSFQTCVRVDPDCPGDYPDEYCPFCYNLRFVVYLAAINEIELEAETKKDTIIQKIKQESLARDI